MCHKVVSAELYRAFFGSNQNRELKIKKKLYDIFPGLQLRVYNGYSVYAIPTIRLTANIGCRISVTQKDYGNRLFFIDTVYQQFTKGFFFWQSS